MAMTISSKAFLPSADDSLHSLANAAFMRMLWREQWSRLPDLAGQRVRQASVAVEMVNRGETPIENATFSVLDIDAYVFLDVGRLKMQ
jgi:soluble lytic murein transglycosylase-like protein